MSRTASAWLVLATTLAALAPVVAPDVVVAPASAAVVTTEATDEPTDPPTDPPTEPEPESEPDPEPDPEPEPEPPAPGTPVLVLGDSLTARGQEELKRDDPAWTVDGVRGRNVRELLPLLRQHLRSKPRGHYRTVVVALGTNVAPEWRKEDYRTALRMLAPRTRAVFVTPYRPPATSSTQTRRARAAERTAHYARWMQELTRAAPQRRCVAAWRALVIRRPELLVDGVHQTAEAEPVWARLIRQRVERCAAR